MLTAMEMNGIAHIQLTVNRFAACREFYAKLFAWLEMRVVFDSEHVFYGVGSRTGLAICPAKPGQLDQVFNQGRIGLHHLCFRARRKEDIDSLYEFLQSIGSSIIHPPEEGAWAPGYYSILFEDPDGIRLEANFIPGKGNFADDIELPIKLEPLADETKD